MIDVVKQTAPSLDTWTSLFLVVSAVGSFLAILLFTDRKGRQNNWPIALIILGFSLILVQYVFIWSRYRSIYPYVYLFDDVWYYLFGPLFYTYIHKFYKKDFKPSLLHFMLPAIFFVLSLLYFTKTKGFSQFEEVRQEILFSLYWSLRTPWVAICLLIVYIIVCLDFIKMHTPQKENLSIQLRDRWISFLIFLFSVFVLAYISYYVLVKFDFFNPLWDYAISFTMALGIYGIGYMAYNEPKLFNGELLTHLFVSSKKEKAELSDETKVEFYNRLTHYMRTSKVFLNNDLRLVHIASELGLSMHIVSEVINEVAGKNFNQYINDYRLEEAESLLKTNKELSVSSIYYEVGFNSRTTFYSAFKNKYGYTPAAYKLKQESNTLS